MKRVGHIGQPRRPNVPGAPEINAAISLLAIMGGGKPGMAEYLADLKNSVDHNEKLLSEIDEKLKEISALEQSTEQRKRELDKQETRLDGKLARADAIMAAVNHS